MRNGDIWVPTLTLLLGGGLIQAVNAYRKGKPESAQIVVNAATVAVQIQEGILERQERAMEVLRTQMHDLERRLTAQLTAADRAREAAEGALAVCAQERHDLGVRYQAERERSRQLVLRVEALEAQVAELQANAPSKGTET